MSKQSEQASPRLTDGLDGAEDLDGYESLLANWQTLSQSDLHQEDQADRANETPLAQVENHARNEMEKLLGDGSDSDQMPNDSFQSLSSAAFMIDRKGVLKSANPAASVAYNAREGMSVDYLGLVLSDGKKLPDTLLSIAGQNSPNDGLHLLQAELSETSQPVSLAVLYLPERDVSAGQYLVIVVDTPWDEAAQQLVRNKFDLTDTESDIVTGFVTGVSLKRIAADRGRSYATVRNQFQSVMVKTGCTSQPDLLRLLLSVSFLMSNLQNIKPVSGDPYEKQIELLRPKGRFLDVSLHGDLQGTPIICLPSLFGQPTTPEINRILAQAGLLLIAVARPGFGKTTQIAQGDDLNQVLTSDISALMDSMDIQSCVFLGRASAARSMVNLMLRIPDRISKCVMINSLVPRPFVAKAKVTSKWTTSLMSAARLAPNFAGFILGTGKKVMFRTGVQPFIKKMYKTSPLDVAAVDDPNVAASIRKGVNYVTQQGLDAGIRDMLDGFEDWSDEVQKMQKPLTLIHGVFDPHVPIGAVRSFCKAYPMHTRLIEVPEGGGLLNYTHMPLILRELTTAEAESDAGAKA